MMETPPTALELVNAQLAQPEEYLHPSTREALEAAGFVLGRLVESPALEVALEELASAEGFTRKVARRLGPLPHPFRFRPGDRLPGMVRQVLAHAASEVREANL